MRQSVIAVALVASSALSLPAHAQTGVPAFTPGPTQNQPGPSGVRIEFVQGTVFLVTGAGSNITLSVGDDGLLMVDAGSGRLTDDLVAAVSRMPAFIDATGVPKAGPLPIQTLRYVINTSALAEHSAGNASLVEAAGTPPQVFAHENALTRISAERPQPGADPTLTFFGRRMAISRLFNGESVELVHMPAAITDGDVVVRFYRSGVVSTGALFDYTQFPALDVARGGSINGLVDALNRVLEMVIPNTNAQAGTYVIGAHGRICDIAELANYRNMVTIIRDRVAAMVEKGMTLAQVQAAKPTIDYDTRWGRNPEWTPSQFVEAVFTSLTAEAK